MSRDYKLYLEDILEAAQKIESYIEGVSFKQLNEDEMRMDAVLRNLGIIGEATKNCPLNYEITIRLLIGVRLPGYATSLSTLISTLIAI